VPQSLIQRFKEQKAMIIFGLVTFAFFLLFMIILPAHTALAIVINFYLSLPCALVVLKLVHDKYKQSDMDEAEKIRPIFWDKLNAFHLIRPPMKVAVIVVAMVLPLLLIKLMDA
jgi:hypothetical protein